MGLNETYGPARSNILMINPLPTVNHAYSLLMQDKNQREKHVNTHFSGDGSSFLAGSTQHTTQLSSGNQFNTQHENGSVANKGNNVYKGKRNAQICSYCKMTNHTVKNCNRLIGFPTNFKFTKTKKFQGPVRGNSAADMDHTEGANNNITEANSNSSSWIIDSGASEHMCFNSESFQFLFPLSTPLLVKLPNSSKGPLLKSPQAFVSLPISARTKSDVKLWHVRLGHLPFQAMKYISSISFLPNLVCSCDICSLARQSKLPFPISQIKSKGIFDLIHIDTWGPFLVPTYNGYKYFLMIVDDFSQGTWTYLLSTKSNTFPVLKWFLCMVERQFASKLKVIRSDNALELGRGTIESAFLNSQGILHQRSCVATPQQNGVVERKHRHLLEIAGALLFQYKLPICYWGECILTATFLINRFPSRVLQGKTPYEILFSEPRSYHFLKSFGCLCYVSTLSHNRSKFEPREKACVFLGYPTGQKGYKVLDVETKKVFVSRDVKFCEDIFPFSSSSSDTASFLFPSPAPSDNSAPPTPFYSIPISHPSSPPSPVHSPLPSQPTSPPTSHISPIFPSPISPSPPFTQPVGLRRSQRPNLGTKPIHLKYYVFNNVYLTDLTTSCLATPSTPPVFSFHALSTQSQHILTSTSPIMEPTSYSQASSHAG
ncbi:PREDICTED: uncharacterized protein LOC109239848 [Nicotiana attenuata]|uniref:uncharacterized protein LOC109239848 n=1 Tax=Nicotiana attenuata TaxID=49451 RepID=UPI000904A719|nr:PREDICTED: uncharacterized protein LOC109239848 [Nicotiana attenuata]